MEAASEGRGPSSLMEIRLILKMFFDFPGLKFSSLEIPLTSSTNACLRIAVSQNKPLALYFIWMKFLKTRSKSRCPILT